MWKKALKLTGKVALGAAAVVLTMVDEEEEKKRQLDNLSDGLDGINIDGEDYNSMQEAEDAQNRGELYDIHY